MKESGKNEVWNTLLDSLSSQHVLKQLLGQLQREQNLQLDQVISLYLEVKQERAVPLSIFATKLYPMEALCKYLHEEEKLSYQEIGTLLQRDARSVWGAYHRARRTWKKPFHRKREQYMIPFSLLQDRSSTVLEHVVLYVHTVYRLTNRQLGKLLHKSPNSMAVLLKRAREKKHGT
ncbi:MAG: hypothetical protein AABX37_03850 [Nanoarchaeota archaeon]